MRNVIILGTIGLLLVVSYFIGTHFSKGSKGSASSFIGSSKSFGSIVIALSTAAAIASGWMLVGLPGVVYTSGNAMTMNALMAVGFTLGYIFIGKKVRGLAEVKDISSIGDLVDARYNNSRLVKFCTATVLFIGTFSYLAAQIGAGASLLTYLFGWDTFISAVLIFTVVIVYVTLGGESAGIMSQAFQGLIMFIAGIILLGIFFFSGGFGAMTEGVLNNAVVTGSNGVTSTFEAIHLTAFGNATEAQSMNFYILGIIGAVCQPATISRMYAIKNPRDLPNLGMQTGIIQGVVSFFGFSIGYLAVLLVTNGLMDPIADPSTVSWAVGEYLGFGMQLLLYTAIMAAIVSSSSTYMTLGASAFAVDILSAVGVKQDDRTKIRTYQIMIVVVGVVAILLASFSGETVSLLGALGWATFMTIFIPVVVIGMFWKKANAKGMGAAAVVALLGNITGLLLVNFTTIQWPQGLPWYMYLIVLTTATGVVVSYLTFDAVEDLPEPNAVRALSL
ncbi:MULTISPECIES: sodium:solute symporter family transporter [unclassified Jeotgalibaca]|uniref:sodium:solute symporter family transporter n=1 Tax=unclassified Jeotgalibaca TaxID=2621505 RepID=UPI003FD03DA1